MNTCSNETPPPLPTSATAVRRVTLTKWVLSLGALGLLLAVAWVACAPKRPSAPTPQPVATSPASPENPVFSHSLDIAELGCPKNELVGSFSVSPDGKRLGIITTTAGGNPSKMVLCDIDGKNSVIAETGDWELRPPLWCSGNRIVTGTSRRDSSGPDSVTESISFRDETTGKIITGTQRSPAPGKRAMRRSLTVWDATTGKIVSSIPTEGAFFAGAVNPTKRNEVVLLPWHSGFPQKDYPPPIYKWDIDTNTISALPKNGLSYNGVTWLQDGDILAYGHVFPTQGVKGKSYHLSIGDTVIVRLDADGMEKQRTSQPIYTTLPDGDKTIKSLGTMIQPHGPAEVSGDSTIWPISTPVGAWIDTTTLKIIDKQSVFSKFGAYSNMVTGAAATSPNGNLIYFSKPPDLWVYDAAKSKTLSHFRGSTGHGLAIPQSGGFLLIGQNHKIDFYLLKP